MPPVLTFVRLFAFVNTTTRTTYLGTKMVKFVTMEMKRALTLIMVTKCFWFLVTIVFGF